MPDTAQIVSYQEVIAGLYEQAADDLAAFLAGLDPADAALWRDEALVVYPDLVDTYGEAAAVWSADTYEEWRDAEQVSGRYTPTPARVAELDQIEANVRYAVGALYGADPNEAATLALLAGSLTRHITAAAGNTMQSNAQEDPQAVGWRRVARPSACRFCRMLEGRGAVYRRATARFKSHDNCRCAVAPWWDWDAPEPIETAYRASQRTVTDADRARVREYLAGMDDAPTT